MYKNFWKRLIDIGVTVPAIVFLLPFLGIIAFLLWVIDGKPILFRQQRPGWGGKLFTLCKFRTMTNARDFEGKLLPDSYRLTSLGRLLRITSLDELPELFNVLIGEMSLVGPRPLLIRYMPYFRIEERKRFEVRPGITGLSQIQGRNDLSWDLRLAKDVEYVKRCSFILDTRIMAITILRVIVRKGLRVDPGSFMSNLDVERESAEESQLRGRLLVKVNAGDAYIADFVQPAKQADAPGIYRLLRESFKDSYLDYSVFQSDKAEKYLEEQIVQGNKKADPSIFVISDANSIIGFYIAGRREEELFLSYIATSVSVRNRGFGRILLSHFESRALEIGCIRTGLEVFKSNLETVRWYERAGYKRCSSRFYIKLNLEAFRGQQGADLRYDARDFKRAISLEKADGFSRILCSIDHRELHLGIIGGEICKVLRSEGLTISETAKAIANSAFGSRRWLLLVSPEPIDNLYGIESADISFYMTKRIALN